MHSKYDSTTYHDLNNKHVVESTPISQFQQKLRHFIYTIKTMAESCCVRLDCTGITIMCIHAHMLNVNKHTHTHSSTHTDLLCTHIETNMRCTYATDLVSHSQIHNSGLTMADPGDMFCVSKDIWISQPTFTFTRYAHTSHLNVKNEGLSLKDIQSYN